MTQQCGPGPPLSSAPPPLSSPPQCWCQPTIVFWCFLRPTIGLHSQQPKQTFVNLYASGHKKGVGVHSSHQPAHSLPAAPSSALTLYSRTSIQRQDTSGYDTPPPLLKVVSHVITIIYKTHSGSVALPAFPSLWPRTLQSIFARNPELLRVSMVARASITWNIQGAQRLPWGPAQGFYSDLIIRHDFFMSYDSPVELESALKPCDSHGNWEGGGRGGGAGGGRGGALSVLLFLFWVYNSASLGCQVRKTKVYAIKCVQ